MPQEIKLKWKYRRDQANGHRKSASNNSGTAKHRGETNKDRLAFAQQQTRENQRVLVITADGRRVMMRRSELDQVAAPGARPGSARG